MGKRVGVINNAVLEVVLLNSPPLLLFERSALIASHHSLLCIGVAPQWW